MTVPTEIFDVCISQKQKAGCGLPVRSKAAARVNFSQTRNFTGSGAISMNEGKASTVVVKEVVRGGESFKLLITFHCTGTIACAEKGVNGSSCRANQGHGRIFRSFPTCAILIS